MRRFLIVLIATAALLAVVLHVGGGWYFAGQIRADSLDVRPASAPMTLEVVAVDARSVTLADRGRHQPALFRDMLYGLAWDDGYGRLSGAAQVQRGEVTRRLTVLTGRPPDVGDQARLDRGAFPADPEVALRKPAREITYTALAGEFWAWFVPGHADTWAVLVHGKGGDPSETFRSMTVTTELGMPSLAITYRNDEDVPHDQAGRYRYGVTEWIDLDGAVQYALEKGALDVVLVGYGMGGAVVASFLESSPLAEHVSAVVLDAPSLDLGENVELAASKWSLPPFDSPPPSLTWAAKTITSMRYGVDWERVDYVDDSDWLTMPALVFHGDRDETVPLRTSQILAADHPDLVRLVVVEGAQHVEAWNADRRTYEREMRSLLAGS